MCCFWSPFPVKNNQNRQTQHPKDLRLCSGHLYNAGRMSETGEEMPPPTASEWEPSDGTQRGPPVPLVLPPVSVHFCSNTVLRIENVVTVGDVVLIWSARTVRLVEADEGPTEHVD